VANSTTTPGPQPQLPGSDRLPTALQPFYETFGTAPSAFLVNRLLEPDELGVDDGFTVFYVEEQAVWLWGIATDQLLVQDPPVWSRENEPGVPWVQDAPSVSVFLVQMVVMSAALHGPHGAAAAWLSEEDTVGALAPLRQLDLPPWHWPGDPARWYAGDDAAAFTCPNGAPADGEDSHRSVWVSALSEDGVRVLEPHLSDAWDYYSPRDG
jgi:hypothetical protein